MLVGKYVCMQKSHSLHMLLHSRENM